MFWTPGLVQGGDGEGPGVSPASIYESDEHGFTNYDPGPATGDAMVARNRDSHPGECGSISGNLDTEI